MEMINDNSKLTQSTRDTVETISKEEQQIEVSESSDNIHVDYFKDYYSYNLIEDLPLLELLVNEILQYDINVIGLDTEYYKKYYKGYLCVLQITYKLNDKPINFIIDIMSINEKYKKDKESLDLVKHCLKKLLSNDTILKVVHSANNDKLWIYEDLEIITYPIYDTQEAYSMITNKNLINSENNNYRVGLVDLLTKYLDISIDKNIKKSFQLTNWSIRPLTNDQLKYACFDSYYLINLKDKLDNERKFSIEDFKINRENNHFNHIFTEDSSKLSHLDKLTFTAKHYFNSKIGKKNTEEVKVVLFDLFMELLIIVDKECYAKDINLDTYFPKSLIFKICTSLSKSDDALIKEIKSSINKKNNKNEINVDKDTSLAYNDKEFLDKLFFSIKTFQIKYNDLLLKDKVKNAVKVSKQEYKNQNSNYYKSKITCKNNVYDNCKMLNTDNEVICLVDKKKMNWYIKKNLASKIDESSFQINFTHNKTGKFNDSEAFNEFYTKERENICNVCGATKDFLRFHLIPHIYTMFFPHTNKNHRSHEILLLCSECSLIANKFYETKKYDLAVKYNVPLTVYSDDIIYKENISKMNNFCSKILKEYKNNGIVREDKLNIKLIELIKSVFKMLDQFSKESYYNILLETAFKTKNSESIASLINQYYEFLVNMSKNKSANIDINDNESNTKLSNIIEIINNIFGYSKDDNISLSKSKRLNLHGKILLEKFNNIDDFCKMWKEYFKETMNPKFFPAKEYDIEKA